MGYLLCSVIWSTNSQACINKGLPCKASWRREWHPTPVLLPGNFHGWRSLVGYSLWGRKESNTTPCPSPTPKVYSNTCPLSRWCHPTISSSVIPFSSCPQSFPASGSFPISQLFASGGQSIGVSASTSVLWRVTLIHSRSNHSGYIKSWKEGQCVTETRSFEDEKNGTWLKRSLTQKTVINIVTAGGGAFLLGSQQTGQQVFP